MKKTRDGFCLLRKITVLTCSAIVLFTLRCVPAGYKGNGFFHTFQVLVGLVVVSSNEHHTGQSPNGVASRNNNAQSSFLRNLISHPFQKCLLLTLEYRIE